MLKHECESQDARLSPNQLDSSTDSSSFDRYWSLLYIAFPLDRRRLWSNFDYESLSRRELVHVDLSELIWHLDVELWTRREDRDVEGRNHRLLKDANDSIRISPRMVLDDRESYAHEFERILSVELAYPLDIVRVDHNKWLILDGIRRLTRSVLEGKSSILCRVHSPSVLEMNHLGREVIGDIGATIVDSFSEKMTTFGCFRKVCLTGCSGKLGTALRSSSLFRADSDRRLAPAFVLTDIVEPSLDSPILDGQEFIFCDLKDLNSVCRVVEGCDLVIHLGGISQENTWDSILDANIVGTYNIFEASRIHGVHRVLFASSNHAVGFWPRSPSTDEFVPPRPDSRYGLSKAFGEQVASLYSDKYGISCAILRIGSCFPSVNDIRMLSSWLSYRDFIHLVEVTAISRDPFAIVNGVSNNDRSFWINSEAFARFGYLPKDNAEVFATNIQPSLSDLDPIASLFIGGWNCIDGFERDGSHGDEWIERRLIDKVHTKRE